MALSHNPEYGGMGMPGTWAIATGEMQSASNMAFAMYPGLTNGASKAIEIGGSDEQKNTYLPKMISGEWTGTMNLTEPHCGTDLGLLKPKLCRKLTAAIKSQARRFSSLPVNTIWQETSSIWCSPVSKARLRA